jgi:hypothetical protein
MREKQNSSAVGWRGAGFYAVEIIFQYPNCPNSKLSTSFVTFSQCAQIPVGKRRL